MDLRAVCLVRAMVRCVLVKRDAVMDDGATESLVGGKKILCLRPDFSGLKFEIIL